MFPGDPVMLAIAGAVLGLLIGSFLNVVIHRLPIMMERDWAQQCAEFKGETPPAFEPLSLARPRSRCPRCGHSITALENIPVISWLLLRGRCKGCTAPISLRYPLIEAVTGLLFALAAWHFGFTAAGLGAVVLIAALLALTGAHPSEETRHYAITALTRALFMGKITRLGAPAESAAAAFEIGLLSIAPHALSLPLETLIRKLGLSATSARALGTHTSPEGAMLQLAYACDNNDAEALAVYSRQLDIPLHQISVAYLDSLIAASALDAALH